jgi:hypothetical protein
VIVIGLFLVVGDHFGRSCDFVNFWCYILVYILCFSSSSSMDHILPCSEPCS